MKPTPKEAAFLIVIVVALLATAVLMTIVEQIHDSKKPKSSSCQNCGRITRFSF
jgi:NADH:ubiquinone oxidoreductase subunit 3 (subunit A)